MESETFAAPVKRAVYAAAGLLQATMAAAPYQHDGTPDRATIWEADLQIALATSLQAQVGARVRREASVAGKIKMLTKGRYGPIDVGISGDAGEITIYIESKWCPEDKLFEALWDAIKLAQFVSRPDVAACYLVYGAPLHGWEAKKDRPVELFDTAEHNTVELIARYEPGWNACLAGGGARPAGVPSSFSSCAGPRVPIHTEDSEDWELRAAQIAVRSEQAFIDMAPSGWPS